MCLKKHVKSNKQNNQGEIYSDISEKESHRSFVASNGTVDVHKLTFYNSRSEINSVSEAPSEGETRLSDDAIGKNADRLSENEQRLNENDVVDNDGLDVNYRNNKLPLKHHRKEINRLKKGDEGKEETDAYRSNTDYRNNEVSTHQILGRYGNSYGLKLRNFKLILRSSRGPSYSTLKAGNSLKQAGQANSYATSSGGSSNRVLDVAAKETRHKWIRAKPLDGIRSYVKNQEEIGKGAKLLGAGEEIGKGAKLLGAGEEIGKGAKLLGAGEEIGGMAESGETGEVEGTREAKLRKVNSAESKDAIGHVLREEKFIEYIEGKGDISPTGVMEDVEAVDTKGSIFVDTLRGWETTGDTSTVKDTQSMERENDSKADEKERISDKTEKVENVVYKEEELQYRSEDADISKDSTNGHEDKDNSQKEENINDIQTRGDKLVEKISDRINTVENDVRKLGENEGKENFEEDADRCLREGHEKLREDMEELDQLQNKGYQMDEKMKRLMRKIEKIYDFMNNYVDTVNQQLKGREPGEAIIQLLKEYSEVSVPVAEDNAKNNNQQTGNMSSDDLKQIGNKLKGIAGKKQGKSSQGAPDHKAGSKKVGGGKRSGAAKASVSTTHTLNRTRTSTKAIAPAAGKEHKHDKGSEHLEHSDDHRKENINAVKDKGDKLVKTINNKFDAIEGKARELVENKDKENFEEDADRCLREGHEKLREDMEELDQLQNKGYQMDEKMKRLMRKIEKIYDFLNNYVDPVNQQLKGREPGEAIIQLLEKYSEVSIPVAEDNARNNNQQNGNPSGEALEKVGNKIGEVLGGKKRGIDMEKDVFVNKFEKLAIVGRRSSLPKETLPLRQEIAREKGEQMYEVAKRYGENLEEILTRIRSNKNDYRDKIDNSVRYKAEFVGSVKDMAKNEEDELLYKEAGKHMYDALLDKVRSYDGIDAIRPMMEKDKENISAWIDQNRDNLNRETVKKAVNEWLAEHSQGRDLKVGNVPEAHLEGVSQPQQETPT
jgi:iron-sulfur cluster repair protein YtfE (RIC family)